MSTRTILLAFFVSCASAFLRMDADECEVRMRTSTGWVCGRVRLAEGCHKYVSFRGVPYGKPPVGHRRFSELEPLDPWDYLLDAREDSPACPQKDVIYGRFALQLRGQSEDCIYLNVHVPYSSFPRCKLTESKGLPIMVMVHGGGYMAGSGLTDMHGPEYLITQNVIVISFNYRINVFGFLSLGNAKIPGNQGLRDIVRALRWVQAHAAQFGGDPDNVTLMGQSVGAGAVHLLSLSKVAEGLFHRIFLMSGNALPIPYTTSPRYAKEIAANFLGHLGINSTDPNYIHDCLITMPLEDIMFANSLVQYDFGLIAFAPVERNIVEGNPLDLLAQGRGSQYPILLGYTDSEVEFFKWLAYTLQILERLKKDPTVVLPSRIRYSFPNDIARLGKRIAEKCFNGNYTIENFVKCYSYMFFKYSTLKIAEWRGLGGAPAYLYKYTYESECSIIKKALWITYEGASHLEDLTYLYRTNSLLGDHVSFPPKNNDDNMKLCNPTCTKDETAWPPVREDQLQYQEMAQPQVYQMKDLSEEEANWVWFYDQVDEEVRNVSDKLKKYFREKAAE